MICPVVGVLSSLDDQSEMLHNQASATGADKRLAFSIVTRVKERKASTRGSTVPCALSILETSGRILCSFE